ncbi:MAG: ECF transporter S component, partial [Duncaniella sp.]|nr:ECF transporter S component [Duncaniella sp.]
MQTTLTLQSLPFGCSKTYLLASAFVLGNILLPRMVHFLPMGGPTWLPIYFFTLVGAYIFGWRVGLLTAI